ncbi:hypothetical protein [Pseudomonas sp. W15Feb9B]|uniref:hypothetical protein n=1 Tax=Pseudomonas sp. W15Feb9B TaxID=550743 RepID=UPI0005972DF5|nr:hypothetical protein [Pseudomonas sp. W15Feb9B]KIK82982.1 hypothetical protein OC71_25450 [Pseudomonas sp. W15Feb9B]
MLQASTGKLFTNPTGHTNLLRGVLYTNMDVYGEESIETAFGKIYATSMRRRPNVMSCEIVEHIEYHGTGPGILVSNSIDVYLGDFSDVISFAMNVICTPDVELANRLLNETPRPGLTSPKKIVRRIYDSNIHVAREEFRDLEKFSSELLGLPRQKYLKVIKAIRTYVTAIHRLSENLDLAYTLLVMAIEALVKDVGEYTSTWEDVEERKRQRLEKAIEGLDKDVRAEIQAAIVESEHLSLTKKFKHFILSNLPPDYFGANAALQESPIGKADLIDALANLYNTRSKYVHELKALPKEFHHIAGAGAGEIALIDDKLLLTMQGLTRLVRSVIKEYVNKQEKIDREPCDYDIENPNLARMRMCPSTWISRVDGLGKDSFSFYFINYVELLDGYLGSYPNGKLYDVREVIEIGFSMKSKLSIDQRTSLVALASLFFCFVPEQFRPNIKISKQDHKISDAPSIQILILKTITGTDTDWSCSQHEEIFKKYYSTRFKPSGFRVTKKLEAGLGLAFAEKLRKSGEHERALAQLRSTADNVPSMKIIRELSDNYDPVSDINWLSIIYPNLVRTAPISTLECNGL